VEKLGGSQHLHLAGMLEIRRIPARSLISRTPAAGWPCHYAARHPADRPLEDDRFIDLGNRPIELAFKLYPWNGMFHDAFGVASRRAEGAPERPLDKGALRYCEGNVSGHPNLLPAFSRMIHRPPSSATSFVRKPPLLARGRQCDAGSAPARRWSHRKAPTARKVLSPGAGPAAEFLDQYRSSAAGWSITRRADYRSVRTRIRSPATRRGFCRMRFFEQAFTRKLFVDAPLISSVPHRLRPSSTARVYRHLDPPPFPPIDAAASGLSGASKVSRKVGSGFPCDKREAFCAEIMRKTKSQSEMTIEEKSSCS